MMCEHKGCVIFSSGSLKSQYGTLHSLFPMHSDHDCQGEENIEKKGRRMGCLATSNETRKKAGKKRGENSEIPRRNHRILETKLKAFSKGRT